MAPRSLVTSRVLLGHILCLSQPVFPTTMRRLLRRSLTYQTEFQLSVPIAEIEVVGMTETPQNVSALATSIEEVGLLHPITLSRITSGSYRYRLRAGRDRLLAAIARGWKDIPALIIEGDEAHLRIAAAQENLVRRKLTCLDESLLLNEWQQAYEHENPSARRGGDRRNRQPDQSANLAFCRYASERTRHSPRTIQRMVGIARKIDEEAAQALRGTELADHQKALEMLCREDAGVQRQAVAKCKGNPRYLRMALEEIYRCRRAKSLCDWFHDDVQLLVGDFAKVGSRIADGSVDLVLVDPPWTEDCVGLGDPLGRFAHRVLKPGGSLLMMLGQMTQLRFLDGVRKHIRDDEYRWWQMCYAYRGNRANLNFNRRVATKWNPVWWAAKTAYENERYFPDMVQVHDIFEDIVESGGKDKAWHMWGQSVTGFQKFIQYLTEPGDLVLDPCVGGGASAVAAFRLGRRFIGVDIDPEAVRMTKRHLEADEKRMSSFGPGSVSGPRLRNPVRTVSSRKLSVM